MKLFSLLCLLITLFAFQADAHKGATGIVKERMDLMKVIADQMKKLAPMAKGEQEIDLPSVAASARIILKATDEVKSKFPEGSTSHVSEARLEIWSDKAKFETLMNAMSTSAKALSVSAQAGDDSRFRAQFGALANSCQDCHKAFRQKKH